MLSLWDAQPGRVRLEHASMRLRCETFCGRPISSQGSWHGFPWDRKGHCGHMLAEGPQLSREAPAKGPCLVLILQGTA